VDGGPALQADKGAAATYYQFAHPFVLDSMLTQRTLGLRPTPLDQTLAETAACRKPPAR
jgi:hypothetical protein